MVEKFMRSRKRCDADIKTCALSDITNMLDDLLAAREEFALWDPRVLFGWFAAALRFLQKNTHPGQAYCFYVPENGIDFTLDEHPELWQQCPDVFSPALSAFARRIKLRVASFLRPGTETEQTRTLEDESACSDDSRTEPKMHDLILLDFSRNPHAFQEVLNSCPALETCRQALSSAAMPPELSSSKAHFFVEPESMNAVVATIVREGWDLKPRHVVVAPEYESQVLEAVRTLPSKLQVRLKSRQTAPLSVTQASSTEWSQLATCFDFDIRRTFIHVHIAGSIYSGPSSGQKVASTTDANPRVLHRPRQGMQRSFLRGPAF